MAQSPDKMFRIDPREVKTVAPISEFTAQSNIQVIDTSIADRSRARGFGNIGESIIQAGIQKKNQQIVEDIRIGEEAAAREEVMPGGLYPIAQRAYRDAIDINTSHATLLAAKTWTEGDEFTNIVKNKNFVSRQKSDMLKNHLHQLKTKAMATIQNPDTLQKMNLAFDELVAENETIINEFEKDNRDLTIIETGTNVMLSATSFAKRVGGENIWKTTFTERFLKNMYKDILQIAPEMEQTGEHKILAFKIITNNQDMLGKPSIMRKLLDTEYSKGISFKTLLIKGSTRNRLGEIDNDAKQFAAVWEEYERNSTAYFASIEANNKASKAIRDKYVNKQLIEIAENGGTLADAKAALKNNSVNDIGKYNTYLREFAAFSSSEKHSFDSDAGIAFEKSLAGGTWTDDEITLAMIRNGISLNDKTYFHAVAGAETSQVKAIKDKHIAAIKIVKSQAVSLLKTAIGAVDIFDKDGNYNRAALMRALRSSKGLDPIQSLTVLKGLQDIDLEFDQRASNTARDMAAIDDFSTVGIEVNKFQNDYYDKIDNFIKNIKEGNLSPEIQGKGGSQKAGLPEGDKKKPEKPDVVIDHHKKLTGDKSTYIEEQTKEIGEEFKASAGEKAKRSLNSPVHTLSQEDQDYYNKLVENISPEAVRQKFYRSIPEEIPKITLEGEDILDLITSGALSKDVPKEEDTGSRTGLGPVVDAIDETVGAVVDYFKDKPQATYELQSTATFLAHIGGSTSTVGEAPAFEGTPDAPDVPDVDVPLPIPNIPFAEGFDFLGDTDESRRLPDSSTDSTPVGEALTPDPEFRALTDSGADGAVDGVQLAGIVPEVFDISNHFFNDQELLSSLPPGLDFQTKFATSGIRIDTDGLSSAHEHGQGFDMRLRNTNNVDAGLLTDTFHRSLERAGYEILLTPEGLSSITIQAEKGPQTWSMFTKNGKDYMMEIEKGEEPHLHIQLGTDFDTTRDIANRW